MKVLEWAGILAGTVLVLLGALAIVDVYTPPDIVLWIALVFVLVGGVNHFIGSSSYAR